MNLPSTRLSVSSSQVVIIGLGYVGLTLALTLTKRGIQVIGVESSSEKCKRLIHGSTEISEPEIAELLASSVNSGLLSIKNSLEDVRLKSRAIFVITVGTPLDDLKEFKTDSILDAVDKLTNVVKDGDLIILRSTVPVGFSRLIYELISDRSNKDILLAFCPERTVEGAALEELEALPQIIGGINPGSVHLATEFFLKISPRVIETESLEAAELIKLINNTFRDVLFGFANDVASFANALGIDSAKLIEAANDGYPRSSISMPGPVGGPCLEKDPWILDYSARKYGIQLLLPSAARTVNENSTLGYLLDVISRLEKKPKTVTLLGLAFKGKPKTLDTRGSISLRISEELRKRDPNLIIFGHEAMGQIENSFLEGSGIIQIDSMTEAISKSDVVIICNNSEELKLHLPNVLKSLPKNAALVDFWRMVDCELRESIDSNRLYSW